MEPALPLLTCDFGDNVSIMADEDISLESVLPVQAREVRNTVSHMTNEDIPREPMPHTKARESVDHVPKIRESTLLEPTLPVRAHDFRDQVLEQRAEKLLMDPEDLFRGLYHVIGLKTDVAKAIVMGQVGLARRRDARHWLESAAYFGTIMFESKWVEESIGKRKRKPSHQKLHSAAMNTPARVRPRANPDKSAMRDLQQQRPRRPQSLSPEPGPSVRSLSPMARESCYEGSPKRSWQEQRPRRPQSPPLKSSNGREGRKRRRPAVQGNRTSQHPSHGIEAISFRLSSQGELKNVRSSQRPVSGLLVQSPLRAQQMLFLYQTPLPRKLKWINRLNQKPALTVEMEGRGKRKVYTCPLAGCTETTLRLKWHVLHQHAPEIFNEDLEPDTGLSNRRYAALSILAKALNGPSAQVEDLAATLNRFKLIGDLWEIQTNRERAMREMCSVMSWSSPEVFSLNPVNSPACLIHWRALTALLQNLSPNVREDLRQTFPNSNSTDATAPECAAVCMREPSPEPVPDRLVFDSHFHLDRLQWSLNLPQDTSFEQTMAAVGRIPEDCYVVSVCDRIVFS